MLRCHAVPWELEEVGSRAWDLVKTVRIKIANFRVIGIRHFGGYSGVLIFLDASRRVGTDGGSGFYAMREPAGPQVGSLVVVVHMPK